jgi:hypothetical protein
VALAAYLVGMAVLGLVVLLGAALLVRRLIRRNEGPPPAWAVALGAVVILAIPIAAAGAYFFVPVPVSDRGLTNSIEREADSTDLLESRCEQSRDESWRCNVLDGEGSGSSDYVVTTGWSCWTARRVPQRFPPETPMPARPDGCTTLRDTLGLFDRLLDL